MRFRRFLQIALIIGCISMCFACAKNSGGGSVSIGENGSSDGGSNSGGDKDVIDIDKDKLPYSEEEIFDQLFDINNYIEVNIDISDEELGKIQKDYEKYAGMGSKSPIYRQANLEITIKTEKDEHTYLIKDVGVRMKGNTSRTDFYNEEEGQFNLIHYKIDFQETFDDDKYFDEPIDWTEDEEGRTARKDRTFATLENIEVRWNKCDDSTYIRDFSGMIRYKLDGFFSRRELVAVLTILYAV